jgi:hypothetical protein
VRLLLWDFVGPVPLETRFGLGAGQSGLDVSLSKNGAACQRYSPPTSVNTLSCRSDYIELVSLEQRGFSTTDLGQSRHPGVERPLCLGRGAMQYGASGKDLTQSLSNHISSITSSLQWRD